MITASTRWDPFVQRWLDLPDSVESTGYLSGAGLVEVQDRLRLGPDQTLVDLGCGRAGYGLAVVAATRANLIGVDGSEVALRSAEAAARRLGLGEHARFIPADLAATGVPSSTADAVLCVDAVHFASSVVAVGVECARILKPGGRLVITTWQPASEEAADRLPERIRRMDIERDLITAGFTDIRVLCRPEWSQTEARFWNAAAGLDPDGDPAIAELRDEAIEFLPLADALCRLLVVAVAPT